MTTEATAEYTGPVHYFASNAMAWATGKTRAEAIEKCTRHAGSTKDIKGMISRLHKKGDAGFYVWCCKVHGKDTDNYRIEWYMPKGIDISEAKHHDVTYLTAKDIAFTTRTNGD